jgi:hypothetical protein
LPRLTLSLLLRDLLLKHLLLQLLPGNRLLKLPALEREQFCGSACRDRLLNIALHPAESRSNTGKKLRPLLPAHRLTGSEKQSGHVRQRVDASLPHVSFRHPVLRIDRVRVRVSPGIEEEVPNPAEKSVSHLLSP